MTLSEAVSRHETRVEHSRAISGAGLLWPKACCSSRELWLGIGSDRVPNQNLEFQQTLAHKMQETFSLGPQRTCDISRDGQEGVALC